ncbi:MAG: hypothetical protein M1826_001705 [Phylliscum demangeonii]|nr:MAG: hypothetical protein M1826_001705 [Phylliscum demangeonii]
MPVTQKPFEPKDAVGEAVRGTMITGAAGLMVSAVQNTLARRNVSAWGVFTRTGGIITTFAAMGGIYEFAKFGCANLRERDDTWNTTLGGLLAGAVLGLRVGTIPAVLGYGVSTSILLSVFEYTGGIYHKRVRPFLEMDEVERQEWVRKRRRRPIQEIIDELGEGRGGSG